MLRSGDSDNDFTGRSRGTFTCRLPSCSFRQLQAAASNHMSAFDAQALFPSHAAYNANAHSSLEYLNTCSLVAAFLLFESTTIPVQFRYITSYILHQDHSIRHVCLFRGQWLQRVWNVNCTLWRRVHSAYRYTGQRERTSC
jgi:hypothetical protein